jgi:hypothetical protein
MVWNWLPYSSVSSVRKNGSRGATMPVSAKRITSGWTHPIDDISEQITVSFQDESDTNSSRVRHKRRERKKLQRK